MPKREDNKKKILHFRKCIISLPQVILIQYKCHPNSRYYVRESNKVFYQKIKTLTTVEMIGNAKAATMLRSILNVTRIYTSRGFKIHKVLMDGEFKCLHSDLLNNQINLNICSESKHVGEIEQQNRTVKDRIRGVLNCRDVTVCHR